MKTQEKKKRPPTHSIMQVIGDGDKTKWIRVGAAWANKDGKGMNLVFDAYPVVGRIVVREIKESEEGAVAPGGQQ